MGNKCCQAEEVAGDQKDIVGSEPALAAASATGGEEVVGGANESEFVVTLTKRDGLPLGIDVDLTGILKIDAINGGLVKEWNDTNPSTAVKVGDSIVAVNGKNGTASELVDICKQADVLKLTIRR
mmetsp:Transcript_41385/g.117070  ORF Transcript_41385/g.117070 Transcript_41385/m.117070 type:complete len:125 (+) Transcript_41385:83-457(+)